MIVIVNKNKKNNKYLPMLSIVDKEKIKKQIKKQLMEEIINNPESLKAYKEIEVYKIADINENMEMTNIETKYLISYEEILKEIVEQITKETKKNVLR